ncbi:MAG TPA: phosphoribosylamine--glycine ligase [Candidatus Dormibacteraeota bacterium]|nr:phosphoribosylamine--glycine ligase [Candidatus Dormibacteraeota bacterium]
MMRILLVGNGARESALAWRLAASASCEQLFIAPGNAGTAQYGTNWDIPLADHKGIAERALAERIDLVVIGPETAIAGGLSDRCRDLGLCVFGPNRSIGRLESSKSFAKRFMERHDVPSARYAIVHGLEASKKVLESWGERGVVVKADGLAAGKGVVVTNAPAEAEALLAQWYGSHAIPGGGRDVVLEERLIGRELSVFALCDGRAMMPLIAACDYKRAGDGDTGPNTGGMGAYSPPHGFPEDMMEIVRERIFAPMLRGLLAENESYIGVLYAGLMWCADGPKVIEFNVRFGDPETQVMMPRIAGDFAALLKSCADGALDLSHAHVTPQHCVGVVLATSRYPIESIPLVDLPASLSLPEGARAFWSASTLVGKQIHSGGGRVLTVTATGDLISEARERAYAAVRTLATQLGGDALTFRSDIALLGGENGTA